MSHAVWIYWSGKHFHESRTCEMLEHESIKNTEGE
jgi:hypothetical protein